MDVLMPQLGETVAEGKISKWFVSAGDSVKPGDNLFEIETDKVSMEVPAIAAGTLAAIHVRAGEVAPVGAVVAQILSAGETTTTAPAPLIPAKAGMRTADEPAPRLRGEARQGESPAPKPAAMEPFREVRSPERNYGPARLPGGAVTTPLARRLAGEAGIDLARIKGSGPRGRIVAADVQSAMQAAPTASAAPSPLAANILLTADIALAHALALCNEVPAIELADIVVKAWAVALSRLVPSDQSAIALTAGPSRVTIHDAALMSLTGIAARRSAADASAGADAATSAICMPGIAGITSVADVMRPPQTTLLGIAAARRAPVEAADGSVEFASLTTATLSCDPRTVDAVRGAQLLAAFKGFVEQPVTMIV